jgi:hypothetical protein
MRIINKPKSVGPVIGENLLLASLPVGTNIKGKGWSACWRIIRQFNPNEVRLIKITDGGRNDIGYITSFIYAIGMKVTVVGPNGEKEA